MEKDSKPTVRIGFSRFPSDFCHHDNFIVEILKRRYEVTVGQQPQIVFYSVFRGELPEGEYVKVFFTGENRRPPVHECDWTFSFDDEDRVRDQRHMRLPLYVIDAYGLRRFREDWGRELVKKKDYAQTTMAGKSRFCAYVASHSAWPRYDFFRRLSKRKHVDAPGNSGNNMPPINGDDPMKSRIAETFQQSKIDFLKDYRFAITFESSSHPGYTTEKIVDAMRAGCIPIYWGNVDVGMDFNEKSFINVSAYEAVITNYFPSFLRNCRSVWQFLYSQVVVPLAHRATIRRVMQIESDEWAYISMLSEPWFNGNVPNLYFSYERLEAQLFRIADSVLNSGSDEAQIMARDGL